MQTAERIVVKVPDSAGSTGNFTFVAAELTDLSIAAIKQQLLHLMHMKGWRDRYPLQVGVWESNVLSSPSAQIWIPQPDIGAPLIEGIFEQIVEGAEGRFVGARPAKLARGSRHRFIKEATMLATLFQHLGYYGRCSLDAIVSLSDNKKEQLHWIECNGRWGGVSIPLTLANELCSGERNAALFIVQQSSPGPSRISTHDFLNKLEDRLFTRYQSEQGIVLLSPCEGPDDSSRLNFCCLAHSEKEAESMAQSALTCLRA